MGQINLGAPPEHKGKLFESTKVGSSASPYRTKETEIAPKKIGQSTKSDYLGSRMRADDSAHVNMSDKKLGGGIRQTGSKK